MKRIETVAIYILTVLLACIHCNAAEQHKSPVKITEGVTIDKDVHDFGEVITGSGPLSCTFTITNSSDSPIVIFSVASSCGCTDVKWTHEPIRPGESGTISATYSNDEGPIAFDKNLTVYFSNVKRPYTLKLRGICKAPKLSKEEIYKRRIGSIGLVEMEANVGQIKRGMVKSATIQAANLSDSPVKLDFTGLSQGLSVAVRQKGSEKTFSSGTIPAGEEFEIVFSVKADGTRWGKSKYIATAVVGKEDDGRKDIGKNDAADNWKNDGKNTGKNDAADNWKNDGKNTGKNDAAGNWKNDGKNIGKNDAANSGKNNGNSQVGNGVKTQEIKVFASIVDNFDGWNEEQKRKGPNPSFKTSSYSFGIIDSGTTIHAEFEMENVGGGTLRIYKCDTDARRYSHSDIYSLKPGEKGKFRVHVDTSLMPKGETDIIVTLTTNSALRPTVNLFICGYIR